MKTVELFAGTQSFSKVARELGHETFCVDNKIKFDNDLTIKISYATMKEFFNKIEEADIVWMSPSMHNL